MTCNMQYMLNVTFLNLSRNLTADKLCQYPKILPVSCFCALQSCSVAGEAVAQVRCQRPFSCYFFTEAQLLPQLPELF